MSETEGYEGAKSEVVIKLCPRCPQVGRIPANEREVSKSGKHWGYCKPCMYEYQKDRRDAQNTLLEITKPVGPFVAGQIDRRAEISEAEIRHGKIQHARSVLEPKQRGRKHGDNKCPRCLGNQRADNSAYCTECSSEYRKDRREERIAALNRALQEAQRLEQERRQAINQAYFDAFGHWPTVKTTEEENE
jgi:hypothetical protein